MIELAFFVIIILLGGLGVVGFFKARRGVKAGIMQGLLPGVWDNQYEVEYDPEPYWVNVWIGFIAAAIGAIAVLFGLFVAAEMIADYLGYPSRFP